MSVVNDIANNRNGTANLRDEIEQDLRAYNFDLDIDHRRITFLDATGQPAPETTMKIRVIQRESSGDGDSPGSDCIIRLPSGEDFVWQSDTHWADEFFVRQKGFADTKRGIHWMQQRSRSDKEYSPTQIREISDQVIHHLSDVLCNSVNGEVANACRRSNVRAMPSLGYGNVAQTLGKFLPWLLQTFQIIEEQGTHKLNVECKALWEEALGLAFETLKGQNISYIEWLRLEKHKIPYDRALLDKIIEVFSGIYKP